MPDDNNSVVRVQRTFDVSMERAFDAWVNPNKVAKWIIGPRPQDQIVRIELDPRLGGKFSFIVNREGQEMDHTGEYLEFDRPRRLTFTWGAPKFSPIFTKVTLSFTQLSAEQTLVLLVQEGVIPEQKGRAEMGWTKVLESAELSTKSDN